MGGIVTLVLTLLVLAGTLPENGLLRIAGESVLKSPVIKGVIALLFIFAAASGIAYGIASGKFKSDNDIIDGMSGAIKTLALISFLYFLLPSLSLILNGVIWVKYWLLTVLYFYKVSILVPFPY